MSSYIIYWKTIVNSFSSRDGYSVVYAVNKSAARRELRRNLTLLKGETLRIVGGAQLLRRARRTSVKSQTKGVY